MNAERLNADFDALLRCRTEIVNDPGNAGVISYSLKGIGWCELVTAGAEARVLPPAGDMAYGNLLIVSLNTAGGAASLTGSAGGTVILSLAGDLAVFQVSRAGTTLVWRTIYSPNSGSALRGSRNGSIAAAGDTATLTAAQVMAGVIRGVPTAAANYTLPTASNMIGGMTGVKIGDQFQLSISNKSAGANTITVLAGGATLEGTVTIAQNAARIFTLIVTAIASGSEAYTVIGN